MSCRFLCDLHRQQENAWKRHRAHTEPLEVRLWLPTAEGARQPDLSPAEALPDAAVEERVAPAGAHLHRHRRSDSRSVSLMIVDFRSVHPAPEGCHKCHLPLRASKRCFQSRDELVDQVVFSHGRVTQSRKQAIAVHARVQESPCGSACFNSYINSLAS